MNYHTFKMKKDFILLIFIFFSIFNISSQEDCARLLNKKIEFKNSSQLKQDLESLVNCGLQREDLKRPFLNELVMIDLTSSDNVNSLTYKDLVNKYNEVKNSKSYKETEKGVKRKTFLINFLVILSLLTIPFLLYILIKKLVLKK